MRRKKLLAVLVGVMILGITGCGSASKESTTNTKSNSESGDVSGKVTEEAQHEKLVIQEKGYSIVDGRLNWGAVVKNPNADQISSYAEVTITAKDDKGKVIATDNQTLKNVFQNATTTWAGEFDVKGKSPKEVIFDVSSGELSDIDLIDDINSDDIVASNPNCKKIEDGYKFTGEIENKAKKKSDGVAVTILLKKDKKIVGGIMTYINKLDAGQKKAFEAPAFDLPSFDEYVISAQSW